MDTEFVINFEDFGEGFSPLAHIDNKTFVGSKGQASEMKADVISNPGFLQQSPALADLTNGNQSGVVTEPIRFILDKPIDENTTYAVGTSKLFKVTPTAVVSSGWPKTITNMTEGESIVRLKNNVYIFYNKSTNGDIAMLPADVKMQVRNAQTAANDNSVGTVAWTNPNNAKTRDDSHAYIEYSSGTAVSNYLKLTNFGFNIPSGATIVGVQIKILKYADTDTTQIYDKYLYLIKSGSISGSNKAKTSEAWELYKYYHNYGSSSDLWGTTLTPSDVNNSNFGLAYSIQINNNIACVDHVEMTVFYTSTSESEAEVLGSWAGYFNSSSLIATFSEQTLEKAPHPSASKEDIMVFGNGRYLGVYVEGSGTLDTQKLDFGEGAEVADVVFHANMWWIAVNYGEGRRSQIYLYDGSAMSNILSDEVGLGSQRIGFLYVLNGIVYVAYDDLTSDGFAIGWVSGRQIKPLRYFAGSLPDHRQKTLYKNTILFASGEDVYSFGATVEQMPIQISRLADGGYANLGGIAAPFGTPMIASWDGSSNYRLAKFSGLSTDSQWKSIFVDTTKNRYLGKIHTVIVSTKPLESGARADITLEGNQGAETSNTLSVTGTNKTRHVFKTINLPAVEDVRVVVNYQNGSATKNCPIRKISLLGNFVER